ncbi:methyltransferase domain-containing protein [Anthocerotibacter panamensis]|uniref:methyltransferase domain-containing protein n=1 Tax=Anthocerotibacter panamensis TaxID=2857077 RepID=UPI001C406B44|nr:methyltransferase domain-containing protein [Anthocerotibacter panamensis]
MTPSYCCPRCKGPLVSRIEEYRCPVCAQSYPVLCGIPDFRVYPDPYIDLEADRAKGQRLAEAAQHLDFPALVAHYYAITPEVPPDLAARYLAHHRAGLSRAQGVLARLKAYGLPPPSGRRVLDLGCGTGAFVASTAGLGAHVIGVDIAFRWLVVARRQLHDLGLEDVPLVCACADYLPFADQHFELMVAENLLEHTRDPALVLMEAGRVRTQGGAFLARTVNRFALAPEPHVGVWGVGFLPRPWMDPYVRLFKGIPYEHIHLQSYGSLRRMVRVSGVHDLRVSPARLVLEDYQYQPPLRRQLLGWYDRLGRLVPALRPLLTRLGPYLDLVSQRTAPAPLL